MIIVMDDHLDELAHMKERGVMCMEAATTRGDQKGFMLWQRSVEKIESLLTEAGRRARN